MSPQLRRMAPLILIAVALLVLLPILKGSHGGKGISSSERGTRTRHAIAAVDAAETAYRAERGRYTEHLADLVTAPEANGLVRDLAVVAVRLDASTNGNAYVAQVASDVLSLVHVRSGSKLVGTSCAVLKRASGVDCPTTKKKK